MDRSGRYEPFQRIRCSESIARLRTGHRCIPPNGFVILARYRMGFNSSMSSAVYNSKQPSSPGTETISLSMQVGNEEAEDSLERVHPETFVHAWRVREDCSQGSLKNQSNVQDMVPANKMSPTLYQTMLTYVFQCTGI